MIRINKIRSIVAILLVCVISNAKASDDQEWYKSRDEAFAIAKEQNKNVLLLYGRTTCIICNTAKQNINNAPINQIIAQSFILWFCDIDTLKKKEEALEYRAHYTDGIPLPLLCTIDPHNPMPALSYSIGGKTVNEIEAMLKDNLPTANEEVAQIPNNAYISDNTLTISNNSANETISVYTIAGQLIDSFDKKDNVITRTIYSYPKGVVVVNSSQGWSRKIVN